MKILLVIWFLRILAVTSVTFMFYYFACAITKKKMGRIALVGILLILSLLLYNLGHSPPKTHRMQEGVLYIRPNPE